MTISEATLLDSNVWCAEIFDVQLVATMLSNGLTRLTHTTLNISVDSRRSLPSRRKLSVHALEQYRLLRPRTRRTWIISVHHLPRAQRL